MTAPRWTTNESGFPVFRDGDQPLDVWLDSDHDDHLFAAISALRTAVRDADTLTQARQQIERRMAEWDDVLYDTERRALRWVLGLLERDQS